MARTCNLTSRLLTITAGTAKSRKAWHLPLNGECLQVLTRWKAQGKGRGLVFPGPVGARMSNIAMSWENLMTEAELIDFPVP